MYNVEKSRIKGKIFTLTHDTNANGRIDIDDLQWSYLEGDGDFRSAEVTVLRDEADIIITNPPFSLFREFLAWIMEGGKQFLIIGNLNAVTYKEVFPLIKNNQIWMGSSYFNGGAAFFIADQSLYDPSKMSNEKNAFFQDGKFLWRVNGVRWFTNIEHGKRHQPLQLMNMVDNLRFNKKLAGLTKYFEIDNYEALEVPYTEVIPNDYNGIMGVPISFLDKYCPEQFEIIGITKTWFGIARKIYPEQVQIDKNGQQKRVSKLNDGPAIKVKNAENYSTYYTIGDDKYIQTYQRILIRKKQ